MTKKQTKSELTREKIVRAAIHVFAEEGFSHTGFKQIGKHCGMSEASIFYHFEDREALVGATLNEIVRHNHEMVSSDLKISDDAETALFKHLRANLKWGLNFPEEAQVLILVYYLGCVNLEFSKTYEKLLQSARQRILAHLYACEREKFFVVGKKGENFAEALHDLLVGGFVNLLSTKLAKTKNFRGTQIFKNEEAKWEMLLSAVRK